MCRDLERDAGESIAQPLLDERYGKVGVERRTLTMACNHRHWYSKIRPTNKYGLSPAYYGTVAEFALSGC